MSRGRLIMSTRNEKAKRLNANEDNLLQMEMERFQKQHNKEMKSIILEKHSAKEAMSGVRLQRASSLLAARMVLQKTNALNNRSDNSPRVSENAFCEPKQNQVSSEMVPGLDTDEDGSSCWKAQSDLDREILNNCNVTSLPSKNEPFGQSRKRAQTFSEGTTTSKIVQSSGTLKNTLTVQKPSLPNPPQKSSNRSLKFSEYLSVPSLASQNNPFERTPCMRPRSFTEDAKDAHLEGACSVIANRPLNHVTISRNLASQYREQQDNSAVKSVPFLIETDAVDSRPRSRSDDTMIFKRVPTPKIGLKKRNLSPNGSSSTRSRGNSPEPGGFHSPLILRASPRAQTPPINRRVSVETTKLLKKRGSLEPCHKSSTQFQNKLSPSRGIAKFRQTGSAAAAAQTLVSRYQREKAISIATEILIAERQRRENCVKNISK